MVPSARKAASRMCLTECSGRAASPQALLSFRLLEGYAKRGSPRDDLAGQIQSYGRGDPGQPCRASSRFFPMIGVFVVILTPRGPTAWRCSAP
jgi:hypothetical protein